MKFLIDDKEYEVVIQKKNNKNTYIRVKEDLKIYVTTSYFASKLYIYNLFYCYFLIVYIVYSLFCQMFFLS